MSKHGRWLAVSMMAAWAMILAGGCASPRAISYDIKISLAESLADSTRILPSVEVHLLALDPVAGHRFQTFPMSDYWNPNRKKDDFVKRIMHFGQNKENPQTLSRRDSIWDRWLDSGAEHLFVLADLPGLYDDKEDVKDPRRLILPLDPKRWQHSAIQVVIEKGGVYCITPRVPVESKK